eukprot:c35466_g1_i1 orf=40-204(-)
MFLVHLPAYRQSNYLRLAVRAVEEFALLYMQLFGLGPPEPVTYIQQGDFQMADL